MGEQPKAWRLVWVLVLPRCGWGVRCPGHPMGKVGCGQMQESPSSQLQKLDFLLWAGL